MITREVISIDYALQNILKIFPSSIIINANYEIEGISNNVAGLLHSESHELVGKNLNEILDHVSTYIEDHFGEFARYGFIRPKQFNVNTKRNGSLFIEVSGFHLGILSDVSNLIVLFVHDLNTLKRTQKKLDTKVDEFNELIYRTYHDLKGPLATIQGLINLTRYNSNDLDISDLMSLVDETVNILAMRITNISKFHFEYDRRKSTALTINLRIIEKEIQEILHANFTKTPVPLQFYSRNTSYIKWDIDVLRRIISSLLNGAKYFIINSDTPSLGLKILKEGTFLTLDFTFNGFSSSEDLKSKLLEDKMSLASSINDESSLWFYVLGLLLRQVDGEMAYDMSWEDRIGCKIDLPC